jgi:hypothetical protein
MGYPLVNTMAVDDHLAAAVAEREKLRFEVSCADGRYEGVERRVALSPQYVAIERRVVGIAMHVNVPTVSYRGVVLRAMQADGATGGGYEIILSHDERSLEVRLHATEDDSDVIALWRSYGARLALPLLLEDREGRLQPVERLSGQTDRRHGSAVRGRRPRFLVRRQPGLRDDAVLRHISGAPHTH